MTSRRSRCGNVPASAASPAYCGDRPDDDTAARGAPRRAGLWARPPLRVAAFERSPRVACSFCQPPPGKTAACTPVPASLRGPTSCRSRRSPHPATSAPTPIQRRRAARSGPSWPGASGGGTRMDRTPTSTMGPPPHGSMPLGMPVHHPATPATSPHSHDVPRPTSGRMAALEFEYEPHPGESTPTFRRGVLSPGLRPPPLPPLWTLPWALEYQNPPGGTRASPPPVRNSQRGGKGGGLRARVNRKCPPSLWGGASHPPRYFPPTP